MKALALTGQWWLPELPERVGGTLHFDPAGRGLILELIGSLEDASVEERLKRILSGSLLKEYPLIHGSCVEEDEVTLYLLQEVGSSGSGPGTFEYLVRIAFLGAMFASPEVIEFTELSISLTHLPSLIPAPTTNPTHTSSPSGE